MKTKHLFFILAIAFTSTQTSFGLTLIKLQKSEKPATENIIHTGNADLSSIVTLHPSEKAFSIKEAYAFPKGCSASIKITKGLQNYTLKITEQENESCGTLFQAIEPLSLSFQEEVDECGIVTTTFYSQNGTYYEIVDSTATRCDGGRTMDISISPQSSDQASIHFQF